MIGSKSMLAVELAGLAAMALIAVQALADSGKRAIEAAPHKVVKQSSPTAAPNGADAPAAVPKDVGKATVELPAETLLKVRTAAAAATRPAATKGNPKVEPGKVRWHASLDAACVAAKKSGKPVLLFHLLGQLDNQFC